MRNVLPSSISAGETRVKGTSLKEAALMGDSFRLRYNTNEFQQLLKHVAVQTDMHASALNSVDSGGEQVDFESDSLAVLQAELRGLNEQMMREREKASERERILIAQMNALRGAHREEGATLIVRIRVLGVSIQIEGNSEYDKVSLDVGNIEIPFGVLDKGEVKVKSGEGWFAEIQTDSGIVNLALVCIVRATGSGKFPLILGEIGFPPFTPSLKEKGRNENITLHFPNLGDLYTELVIT